MGLRNHYETTVSYLLLSVDCYEIRSGRCSCFGCACQLAAGVYGSVGGALDTEVLTAGDDTEVL